MLNSCQGTPVFLQNSPKNAFFFCQHLGRIPKKPRCPLRRRSLRRFSLLAFFDEKIRDLPFPATGRSATGRQHTMLLLNSVQRFRSPTASVNRRWRSIIRSHFLNWLTAAGFLAWCAHAWLTAPQICTRMHRSSGMPRTIISPMIGFSTVN